MSPLRLRLRSLSVWVLWLALALPLAHLTAFGHGLSHLRADTAGPGKQAPHSAPCEQCLAATAATAAGPVAAPAAAAWTALRHAAPAEPGRSLLAPASPLAYRSRAPPAPLR